MSKRKKLLILAGVALLLWLVISQPGKSADGVHNVLGWLQTGANSVITFVKGVFA